MLKEKKKNLKHFEFFKTVNPLETKLKIFKFK